MRALAGELLASQIINATHLDALRTDMSFNKQIKLACRAQAAAVIVVCAAHFFALQSGSATAQTSAPVFTTQAPGTAQQSASQVIPLAMSAGVPVTAKPLTAPTLPAPGAASAPACTAPAELAHFEQPLAHTMRHLAEGQPLTIVAIGSSSTAGAGASSPAASYPSRLAVELRARFPGREITVLNRGVNGEETTNMMARFSADVLAAHPQLVLWQIGTNSVLRDHPLSPHAVRLHDGVERLKAAGADVVLIDPQFAQAVLAKSETEGMVEQIALAAKEENVDLFRRFAIMRNWHDVQHLSFDAFVSPDGLHMNDWSYACIAKLLGIAIAEAATRPIAAAAIIRQLPQRRTPTRTTPPSRLTNARREEDGVEPIERMLSLAGASAQLSPAVPGRAQREMQHAQNSVAIILDCGGGLCRFQPHHRCR